MEINGFMIQKKVFEENRTVALYSLNDAAL